MFTDTYRKDGLRVDFGAWRRHSELVQLLLEFDVPRKDRRRVVAGKKERFPVREGPTCYPLQHTAALQHTATRWNILQHTHTHTHTRTVEDDLRCGKKSIFCM